MYHLTFYRKLLTFRQIGISSQRASFDSFEIQQEDKGEEIKDEITDREDTTKAKKEKACRRSKQSRDRKKLYLEELETRVRVLEKENIKLRNEIDRLKIGNENSIENQVPKHIEVMNMFKVNLLNTV